jgi:glycine/D-amino acid oxidase-like deaminating enzyme
MKRDTVLDQIENTREPWDFLVIGGGATGLGVAVDASARGYHAAGRAKELPVAAPNSYTAGFITLNRATSRLCSNADYSVKMRRI